MLVKIIYGLKFYKILLVNSNKSFSELMYVKVTFNQYKPLLFQFVRIKISFLCYRISFC